MPNDEKIASPIPQNGLDDGAVSMIEPRFRYAHHDPSFHEERGSLGSQTLLPHPHRVFPLSHSEDIFSDPIARFYRDADGPWSSVEANIIQSASLPSTIGPTGDAGEPESRFQALSDVSAVSETSAWAQPAVFALSKGSNHGAEVAKNAASFQGGKRTAACRECDGTGEGEDENAKMPTITTPAAARRPSKLFHCRTCHRNFKCASDLNYLLKSVVSSAQKRPPQTLQALHMQRAGLRAGQNPRLHHRQRLEPTQEERTSGGNDDDGGCQHHLLLLLHHHHHHHYNLLFFLHHLLFNTNGDKRVNNDGADGDGYADKDWRGHADANENKKHNAYDAVFPLRRARLRAQRQDMAAQRQLHAARAARAWGGGVRGDCEKVCLTPFSLSVLAWFRRGLIWPGFAGFELTAAMASRSLFYPNGAPPVDEVSPARGASLIGSSMKRKSGGKGKRNRFACGSGSGSGSLR
ncbi:hypothetical protein IWX49DRAFT_550577 [Phyllosticta citricarpa]